MATTTAPARGRTRGRLPLALVAVVALVGVLREAVPSVLRLLDPPDPLVCPAIWPPATSCVPGAHLVVVAGAVVVLVAAWLTADAVVRRVGGASARAGALAVLAVLALAAWAAARVPQPFLVGWYGLTG